MQQWVVADERLSFPVPVLGLEEELDDQPGKKLALGKVRVPLEIGTMRLPTHHHLVREHLASWRNERIRAVLLLERDRQAACLEQAENIAGGLVGKPALAGDDVMLGAVAGRDVVLGQDGYQIRAGRNLVNLLGLAF